MQAGLTHEPLDGLAGHVVTAPQQRHRECALAPRRRELPGQARLHLTAVVLLRLHNALGVDGLCAADDSNVTTL